MMNPQDSYTLGYSGRIVYYETIKGEVKTSPIKACRFDERLKIKGEESTGLIHWVVRGTGTPKDKDEVNRREVSEYVYLK
jgi:hypothetical protein